MADNGFICLFRQFKNWQHYQEGSVMRVFIDLLLSANFEPTWFRGVLVDRGCTAVSVSGLEEHTNLSRKTIIAALRTLERTGEIEREKMKFGYIIKIVKYNDFQSGSVKIPPPTPPATPPLTPPVAPPVTTPPTTPVTPPLTPPPTPPLTPPEQQSNKENNENNIINNNIYTAPSNEGVSAGADPPPGSPDFDVGLIADFFNNSLKQSGAIMPRVKAVSGKRATHVKARVREHGLDAVYEVITKAAQSDFLNGKNRKGWIASFDWIFLPTNFPKVLEGNYDNRTTTQTNGQANNHAGTGSDTANTVTGFRVHRAKSGL